MVGNWKEAVENWKEAVEYWKEAVFGKLIALKK